MTTIVYRDNIMCADTAVFRGNTYSGVANKIVRLDDGRLVGAAGNAGVISRFVEHLRNPANNPPPEKAEDEFCAMVVSLDGSIQHWNDRFEPNMAASIGYYAIGSGEEVARGAMEMGASAIEAVNVACRLDAFTRQPIQIEFLQQEFENGESQRQAP